MPDSLQDKVFEEILRPALAFLTGRQDRKTLRNAGKLHFWSDGMLHEIKLVRDGKATPETFAALRRKYQESGDGVTEAIRNLVEARNKLGGGPVARAINDCVFADGYGKGLIRGKILRLSEMNPGDPGVVEEARDICETIETLNAGLERLRRLIEG